MLRFFTRIMRRSAAIVVVAALVLCSIGLSGKVAAKQPVRIGVLTTLTGDYSLIGFYTKKSVQMAVNEINEKGGINGTPVEAVFEDDAGVNSSAVNAFNRLVYDDKVVAIVGSTLSTIDLALSPLIARQQIPFIALGSNVNITKQNNPWVFRPRANDALSARALAVFAVENLHLKKVGIMNSTDSFAQGYADIAKATLKQLGVEPVAVEVFNNGDKDYTAPLLNMKKAEAEGVIMVAQQADAGLILKQYDGLGLRKDFKIIGSNSFITKIAVNLGGAAAAEGVYAVADYVPTNPDPTSKSFTQRYISRYDTEPEFNGAFTYDAFNLLVHAIKEAGSTDRNKIRAALLATKDYPGVTQPITFRPDGEGGTQSLIVQFHNGKIEILNAVKAKF